MGPLNGPSLLLWGNETNPQFIQRTNPVPVEIMSFNTGSVVQQTVRITDKPSLIFGANTNRRNGLIQIVDAGSLWFSFDGRENVTPDINFLKFVIATERTLDLAEIFKAVPLLAIWATLAQGASPIIVHTLELS